MITTPQGLLNGASPTGSRGLALGPGGTTTTAPLRQWSAELVLGKVKVAEAAEGGPIDARGRELRVELVLPEVEPRQASEAAEPSGN